MTDERLTRALSETLHDLATGSDTDYIENVLAQTARIRQRPAWTFPVRYMLRTPLFKFATAAVTIMAIGLGSALLVGERSEPPAPPAAALGLASNGLIAFGSAGDIWVAEPDGSEPRQITSGPTLDSMPYWSPDGTRLAYWSQADRFAPSQLVVVNPDGTEPMTLATHPDGQLPTRTDWSPDGTRLAYSVCPAGTGNACALERIFIASADGSGAEQVGDPELGTSNPDWSPDGQWIAFGGSPREGSDGVYVMAADGSDVRRLVPDEGDDFFAYYVDWAPDGEGVVTQDGDSVVYVPIDGDGPTTLAPGGVAWWSPDGSWIAYDKDMSRLALVSADGTAEADMLIDRPGGFVWSPDATRLVVLTGASQLAIIDVATSDVLATIPAPGQGYPGHYTYPSWQRLAP